MIRPKYLPCAIAVALAPTPCHEENGTVTYSLPIYS